MMDGRVKTLHPAVHAGLLARRDRPDDIEAMGGLGYEPIDLVCVNLYPFHEATAREAPLDEALEQVDIGGPTMLRSAAKNHPFVWVVVDPADYGRVLAAVEANAHDDPLRFELAVKVFEHTSAYDAAIASYFGKMRVAGAEAEAFAGAGLLPERMVLPLRKVQALRYGENPDQVAAFYSEDAPPAGSLPALEQLHGKELSFNNLLDVDAAVSSISAWDGDARVACAVIKHTTPCGLALGDTAEDAYRRALSTDPVSAFGGIVAFNRPVDGAVAAAMAELFLEIIVAPGFEAAALETLTRKKNLRLLVLPNSRAGLDELDFKRVRGGLLAQRRMNMSFPEDGWKVVTKRAPDEREMADLRFAWRAAASVKSNAIVLAKDARTIGIGAGQMARVDASRIAVMKAQDQKAEIAGAVLASDAFFPFRDGVDAAAEHGVTAVIEPGGSVRDEEVIAAADEHGIAMVFTGRRVFRH
jgi:phosphoribosylaminoimidazolecarboxamide formyltransferase/IMP cyclohydrolase